MPIDAADLHLARPDRPSGAAALVLAGSSGRLETDRAELLATAGVTALALRWFGGSAGPRTAREVPLERFVAALDLLAGDADRLSVVGLSYGAEAALLTAVRDPRVDAVVAIAPTDVVWEGDRLHEQDRAVSKWTWRGSPLPFVPLLRPWSPAMTPPAFVDWYAASRAATDPADVEAATIPVERIAGEVLLVAGGDDRVWPSTAATAAIAARRSVAGLATEVIVDPRAGHPIRLPGEPYPSTSRPYAEGGDAGAAERLGLLAWPAMRRAIGAAQLSRG